MLFTEQISLKPNLYPWTNKFIEATQANLWTDKEFSFKSDIQDFKIHLTDQERTSIIRSLSMIGQVEIAVKKFWSKLGDTFPHPSINDLGYVLAYTETVHGLAYSRLLEVLGIENAFDDNLKLPLIKGRVSYLRKHLEKYSQDDKKQFIYSIILFTLFIENVSLFSQFYIVNWFRKEKNILKDTCKQIEYTFREESIHTLVGIKLIQILQYEYPELFDDELKNKILQEVKTAIEYESQIVDWILNGISVIDLNGNTLQHFIRNRMNFALKEIGYGEPFYVDPFEIEKTKWFDELLHSNSMTDFFDGRPVEYTKNNNYDDLFDD